MPSRDKKFSKPGKRFGGKDRYSGEDKKDRAGEEGGRRSRPEKRSGPSRDLKGKRTFNKGTDADRGRDGRSKRPGGGRSFKPRRDDREKENFRPEERGGYGRERRTGRDGRPKSNRGFEERKNKGRDKGSYGEEKRFKSKRDFQEERDHTQESHEGYGERNTFSRGKENKRYKPKKSRRKDSETGGEPKRTHADEGLIRLNRYIANAGICSRREADTLIATGVISVNGKTVTEMGYKVAPGDVVKYGGQTLKREKHVYVILNKPKGYITTVDDERDRKTVLDLVEDAGNERIYPVGRLDRDTTGVLLLTNDGELTKRLTHPSHKIPKIYYVELDKNLKTEDLHKIAEGIELEDGFIKADDISYVGESKREIGIEIHSGRNRIVRRIFDSLGYGIKKLDRVAFAGLNKKNLSRGRWRFLTEQEVGQLYMTSNK